MALGFVVSPAKKMNVVEGPPWPTTTPEHMGRARLLHERLRELNLEQAQDLWRCSDRLAQVNYDRLALTDLDRDLTAAILAYEGIQYQHLAASVLDEDGLTYLEGHLRILSGLYGILRPTDGVVPYRLEMQAHLSMPAHGDEPATADLYAFWGDALATSLARDFELVVNVASVEYAKAVTPHLAHLGIPVLTCLFGSVRPTDGKFVQRATEAKAARGTFVRWCAEHGVEDSCQLRDFCERGYRLSEDRSDEHALVFVRQ
jgi:cytoplasmic iron level regulating protein YaaA (DUF328/UPF0246 family)